MLNIVDNIPLLEDILGVYRDSVGAQFDPYRNHVYRVVNYCFAFWDCQGDDQDKLVIAGCFHDLGIWPEDHWDYLPLSIERAKQYLSEKDNPHWSDEIVQMIDLHHRFRAVAKGVSPLVEVFRKGDWVDASLGWRRFGLDRSVIREVSCQFPNLGFHRNLFRLGFKQLVRHPLNPMPMMKW
ncbi:MAG: HD domain-containing protein [Algisphaera sp.]